ncbi:MULTISPECIES: hypothetical protein [Citrobacter]|uniref:Uncharacterized protein n=1 Tax=Citrobacter amalonaticus TaxID=35703 RepID=A0A6N2V6P1_CITAM|nr:MULTISPECIES: hypothetical protein [Citrobacter]ELB4227267.1 hypothetical protein [Citrobacter amalonaticus]MBJ8736104.1 hypothetical protein [Citrobacter amalonaticus]MBJ9074854.1 hypothetical protein [Citrobacter amalonaticus]MDM3525747.1 hypothetical protein [Citrobacter sp. Ca226]QMK76290.1 hypothetical protein HVX64_11090 [Citrobacter sp. RHB20-C16]
MEKVNMQMARRWMRVAITPKWTRQPGAEVNLQRVVESILPVASLYGVDIANIDPEWFRDQTTR